LDLVMEAPRPALAGVGADRVALHRLALLDGRAGPGLGMAVSPDDHEVLAEEREAEHEQQVVARDERGGMAGGRDGG
jgi:hypothetical protein